jgi:hypothetical protein
MGDAMSEKKKDEKAEIPMPTADQDLKIELMKSADAELKGLARHSKQSK